MSGVAASLPEMLGRLKLTAMRDRLDGLLDEAARRELTLAETLALLCEAEVAHREERRIQMGLGIAKFPWVRTLEGFDFAAQPSLDPKQVRELATQKMQDMNCTDIESAIRTIKGTARSMGIDVVA